MLNFFQKCPGCGGRLVVTECRCTDCGLQMRGEFASPQFASLSDEQLTFIRIFIRARGNLTEVEKVLGVSYPTIRNKLDEINKALESDEAAAAARPAPSAAEEETPEQEERRALLEQVSAGKISAAEAVEKLRNMSGGR